MRVPLISFEAEKITSNVPFLSFQKNRSGPRLRRRRVVEEKKDQRHALNDIDNVELSQNMI